MIYPFEKTVFPRKVGSPFVGRGGVKGPGGIREEVSKEREEVVEREKEKEKEKAKEQPQPADPLPTPSQPREKRRYTRRTAGPSTPIPTPAPVPRAMYAPSVLAQAQPPSPDRDRTVITAAGGALALGSNAHVEKLPSETGLSPSPLSFSFLV